MAKFNEEGIRAADEARVTKPATEYTGTCGCGSLVRQTQGFRGPRITAESRSGEHLGKYRVTVATLSEWRSVPGRRRECGQEPRGR